MFDFTKSPKLLLVELINSDNLINLTPKYVVFGLPSDNPIEGIDRNTTITVSGTPDSTYIGSRELYYDRVPIDGFVGTTEISISRGEATKVSDIIDEINAALNINLTAADYHNDDLPPPGNDPEEPVDFSIRVTPESLVYRGSLDIKLESGLINLENIITVRALSGFIIDSSQIVEGPPPEDLLKLEIVFTSESWMPDQNSEILYIEITRLDDSITYIPLTQVQREATVIGSWVDYYPDGGLENKPHLVFSNSHRMTTINLRTIKQENWKSIGIRMIGTQNNVGVVNLLTSLSPKTVIASEVLNSPDGTFDVVLNFPQE